MQTFTFTELLRTPKIVAAAVDADGPARVTRRDGPDLILSDADDHEHQQAGIAAASAYLRATLDADDRAAAIRRAMPWTSVLTDTEVAAYAADMDRLVWAATDLGQYTALLHTHDGWRATAEAYAAGLPRGDGSDLIHLDLPEDADQP